MKNRILILISISCLLFAGNLHSFAQERADYKVNDTVEVHSFMFDQPWTKAQILQVGGNCSNPDKPYLVHFIGKEPGLDRCFGANEIRPLADTPTATNQQVNTNGNQAANTGKFKVGDRVDDVQRGIRGTVIEINGYNHKLHYDGCGEKFDVWADATEIRPETRISANNEDVRFLVGKWSMTSVAVNSDSWGTIAAWGKAPGLQINSDGTYIWYQGEGKDPIKGKWTPHAKIEGARTGTEVENGIIIKDAKDTEWKVYRRKSTLDNDDHITIRLMCTGMTEMGTRVR